MDTQSELTNVNPDGPGGQQVSDDVGAGISGEESRQQQADFSFEIERYAKDLATIQDEGMHGPQAAEATVRVLRDALADRTYDAVPAAGQDGEFRGWFQALRPALVRRYAFDRKEAANLDTELFPEALR
jgi:hypothetical protein